jgi:hypothetical protein
MQVQNLQSSDFEIDIHVHENWNHIDFVDFGDRITPQLGLDLGKFPSVRRKNWRFSQKNNVMIKILHNLALF